MGYFPPEVAAVRLLAGHDVHRGQPLVLLGALPDLSQPPLPDGRDGLRRHRHRPVDAQDPPPPNGTIFDRLARLRHQLAQLLHRPAADGDHPVDHQELRRPTSRRSRSSSPTARRARCRRSASSTPSSALLTDIGAPLTARAGAWPSSAPSSETVGGDEEDPQDMYCGEAWAHRVIDGGAAVARVAAHAARSTPTTSTAATTTTSRRRRRSRPDAIPPDLTAGDVAGGYDDLRAARSGGRRLALRRRRR